MKAFSTALFSLFLLTISATVMAQWRVISIKPNAKVYADGQLVKKGDKIKPTTQLKFTNNNDYLRVYVKKRAPFSLGPGGKTILEGEAKSFVIRRKRVSRRRYSTFIETISSRIDAKIWLTGAPLDAAQALKNPKPLLFIKQARLYFNQRVFQDTGKFFFVYTYKGKRKINPLKNSYNPTTKIIQVTFGQEIYKEATEPQKIGKSALFIKIAKERPQIISRFRPKIIDEPDKAFTTELEELFKILDKVYRKIIRKERKKLTKNGYSKKNAKWHAKMKSIEKKFDDIIAFFADRYEATPDRNSVKAWLVNNYPDLQVPGKRD